MKYDTILEELEVQTDIEKINKNFRKYLEQVFTDTYLSKIDRVFKEPIIIDDFNQKSNIVALTTGKKISVNSKFFNDLPSEKAMMYIIHELFHVLQNVSQFPEIKTANRMLKDVTLKKIEPSKINLFLTGKEQNIHSDYKDEFLSYCSNFAFDWKLCPELKNEYYNILKNIGVFNLNSSFWKKRFFH